MEYPNNRLLLEICDKKKLRVITFLTPVKEGFDWCLTDIAKGSKVSRTLVRKMVKDKVLVETRVKHYKINPFLLKRKDKPSEA